MEQETEPQTIVDQLFQLLEQLILPNWNDLMLLLPWVLIVVVIIYLVRTAWQWRRASAINRPRVAPRLAGGAPPPGVHLPGPSRWPFVVPIGLTLLLFAFALPARDEAGAVVGPFNGLLFVAGLIVSVIAIAGWLRDAMREWRSTAQPADGIAAAHAAELTAGTSSSVAVMAPAEVSMAASAEPFRPEPPPGVHLPPPSPWPFFAPIGLTVMLFGVIFSPILIIGGLILAAIAAAGWYREASHEYRTTEEFGHPVARTNDPLRVWPRRLVALFSVVIAISLLITLAPLGLEWLNNLRPAGPSATPVAVPSVPEITASSAVSFETTTLIVPCCREFELVFHNNDAGVPHNVELTTDSSLSTVLFDGEIIDGVASITYDVPAIDEGDYYFLCKVHPPMNGSLLVRPENGAPPGPGQTGDPGASPGPGTSPPADGQPSPEVQPSP